MLQLLHRVQRDEAIYIRITGTGLITCNRLIMICKYIINIAIYPEEEQINKYCTCIQGQCNSNISQEYSIYNRGHKYV